MLTRSVSSQESSSALSFFKETSKDLSAIPKVFGSEATQQFPFQIGLNWHGLTVHFYLQSQSFFEGLCSFFPKDWLITEKQVSSDLSFYIYDDILNGLPSNYWQDENADCHTFTQKGQEWACQRDFVAVNSEGMIQALMSNEISDGFFNLMRWALPRHWIAKGYFLFHSSCVLDEKKQAYLCLGPSGAGKTTISQFLPKSQVLGDDMNLVGLRSDGTFFATPSLLGQKFENRSLFGERFDLNRVFWLKKGLSNRAWDIHEHSFRLKICTSLVNIFWQDLSSQDYLKIQNFIEKMSSRLSFQELEFSLNKRVWDEVFS